MHRAVASSKLATIFENYAKLNFDWDTKKERLQFIAQLQNMIAAVKEFQPSLLKSNDLFIIIDMHLRLGEALEDTTAMDVFNTAYDLLSTESLQRGFKWYFFNASIRYCQAQLYTKIPIDFEKHAVDSCTVMRAAFAKCDIGIEEFEHLDTLYGQVLNLLLDQQLFFLARENAKALLNTLVNWSDRAECTPVLKHRIVMFANKLARLYLEHRLIDQAEEFLKQAECLAVKLLPASSPATAWVRMETAYLLGWWHDQKDMSALAGHYFKMAWEFGKPHHFKDVSDEFLRFNMVVLDAYLKTRPDFSALSEERELAVIGLKLIRGIKNKRKGDFDSLLKCFTYLRDTQLPYHFEYHVYQFGVSFFC